jgi:hypothetical protein
LLLIGVMGEGGKLANAFFESLMIRDQLAEGVIGSEQRILRVGRLVRELSLSHARLLAEGKVGLPGQEAPGARPHVV